MYQLFADYNFETKCRESLDKSYLDIFLLGWHQVLAVVCKVWVALQYVRSEFLNQG